MNGQRYPRGTWWLEEVEKHLVSLTSSTAKFKAIACVSECSGIDHGQWTGLAWVGGSPHLVMNVHRLGGMDPLVPAVLSVLAVPRSCVARHTPRKMRCAPKVV